jgi:cytochrome c-type biogenesis protein CcmH
MQRIATFPCDRRDTPNGNRNAGRNDGPLRQRRPHPSVDFGLLPGAARDYITVVQMGWTMIFWIAAGGMGLAVAALLLLALVRGNPGAEPAAAADLRVYRDQLREVERDLARGLIPPTEADRLRSDIGRRVLEADRALRGDAGTPDAPRWATSAIAAALLLIVAGGVWTYSERLGAPGYPDLPIAQRIAMADRAHAERPGQAEAEAEAEAAARALPAPVPPDPAFLDLMTKLRSAVEARPDDLRGQELLARNEAGLGNFAAAKAAQAQVVALKADSVTANDHAALAEMMILAAGGYISPEAEAELTRALKIDPKNGTATYYAGLMFLQTGRPDRTFALWAPLLDRSRPDDPWTPALRAQLSEVAARAGAINYTMPPEAAAPGPSTEEVEAAQEMSPEQRQEMIRGMVAQLNDRLATEGGPATDWARLISAYGVLGETARAVEVWTEARQVFADRPADLATVRQAAEDAGVSTPSLTGN